MNNLAKVGLVGLGGMLAASVGVIIAQEQYSKELEEVITKRNGLIEEQFNLIDDYKKLLKENIDVRDVIIEAQHEIIAKFDPDLAAKLKRAKNIKLVK